MDYTVHDMVDAGMTDKQIVATLVARGCAVQRAWDRVDIARTI